MLLRCVESVVECCFESVESVVLRVLRVLC